jgi:predicted metal-dependent hydrolase
MISMLETGSVQFGSTAIDYSIQRSERRKKTISISVDTSGVKVTVPKYIDKSSLQKLVYKKAPWICDRLTHIQQLLEAAPPPKQFVSGESIRYLGRQYRLQRINESTEVRLHGRFLEIPDLSDSSLIRQQLIDWYSQQATEKLPQRVEFYSKRFGLTIPPIFIRNQRKRWGSCNSKGELRFNWKIIMASMSLIDYVVAHELCHIEHLNHSKAFWHRLGQIMPDYARRKERLARSGILLDF